MLAWCGQGLRRALARAGIALALCGAAWETRCGQDFFSSAWAKKGRSAGDSGGSVSTGNGSNSGSGSISNGSVGGRPLFGGSSGNSGSGGSIFGGGSGNSGSGGSIFRGSSGNSSSSNGGSASGGGPGNSNSGGSIFGGSGSIFGGRSRDSGRDKERGRDREQDKDEDSVTRNTGNGGNGSLSGGKPGNSERDAAPGSSASSRKSDTATNGSEKREADRRDPPGQSKGQAAQPPKQNAAHAPGGPKGHVPPGHIEGFRTPEAKSTHSPKELLAVGLSKAAMNRARALGFGVGHSTHANHGKAVTLLEIPPNMSLERAQQVLGSELPGDGLARNNYFRIYRAANEGPLRATGVRMADIDGRERCKQDRCSGRSLIQWQENLSTCSQKMKIGIIDTAIDYAHPTLSAASLSTGTFTPEGSVAAPNWHGTAVTSLLAGDARGGTPGLTPNSSFYAANAFYVDAAGEMTTDTLSLLKALEWLNAFDVQLVNMSFAGPKDDLVQKAIADMHARGVVFVAAAGNEGPTAPPRYPAAYPQVIAVTAIDNDLRNYSLANRGTHIDLAAPGVKIWSAVPGSQEGYYSGTSFAAPYVTAVVASMLAQSKVRSKEALLSQIEVKDLGAAGRDPVYGRGLVMAPANCNAPGAVAKQTAPSATATAVPRVEPAKATAPVSAAPAAAPSRSAPAVASGWR